jgi:hypothetical protein
MISFGRVRERERKTHKAMKFMMMVRQKKGKSATEGRLI